MPNTESPEGQIWLCGACGKRSRDKYGARTIDRGWDVSCTMNSVLVYEEKKDGKYIPVHVEPTKPSGPDL